MKKHRRSSPDHKNQISPKKEMVYLNQWHKIKKWLGGWDDGVEGQASLPACPPVMLVTVPTNYCHTRSNTSPLKPTSSFKKGKK